jgi:hypothetical protein
MSSELFYKRRLGDSWSDVLPVPEGGVPKGIIFTYCTESGEPTRAPRPRKRKTTTPQTPTEQPSTDVVDDKQCWVSLPGKEPLEISRECLTTLLLAGVGSLKHNLTELKKADLDWDNQAGDVTIQFRKRHAQILSLKAQAMEGEAVLSEIQSEV